MFPAAAPTGQDERPTAPIAPRRSRPSWRKNAHRGLAARCRAASGKSRSQARAASEKNCRSPTTARRTHLLPQTNQPPKTLPTIVITPRAPDFAHISFSFPIENEFTGLYLGIGFTLTFDRYGNVYVSVNGVAGLPTAKGRSAMVGWMNSSSTPSDSQLSGMLSSWGGGAQVGYGGFGLGFYGNSSGTSESGGYSTSGASVYGGYTWEMPSISPLHW